MLNLVSSDWVTRVGLKGKDCKLEFKVVDSGVRSIKSKLYDIPLVSRSGKVKIIKAYEMQALAAVVNEMNEESLIEILSNTSLVPGQLDNSSGTVHLLLGNGCAGIFPETKLKHENLCLMSSDFGVREYFISGQQSGTGSTHLGSVCNVQYVRVTPVHNICSAVVAQLDELKSDFMSIEELGIRPPPICKTCKNCAICKPASQFLSLKDCRELNVIKSNLSYDECTQCWTAKYPFLKDPSMLGNNYESAFRALKRREKKLLKDKSLGRLYDEQVQDFVKRGVIRKMTKSELSEWQGPVRYVDHHEVFKEDSTTPLRIVINSSFHDKNEPSFNDILMKGPNVLTNLFDIW